MSKTVKRVSKTVKRVTRVMMIGLVAMLGVKAEAHYIVAKGRCVWHSLECGVEDTDVPDPSPVSSEVVATPALALSEVVAKPPLPLSEVVAKPDRVEILCANRRVRVSTLVNESVTLASQKPVERSDITEVKNPDGKVIGRTLAVAGIVTGAHFLEDPDICPNSIPEDVIIRTVSVEVNLYCSPDDKDKTCSGSDKPHSSWIAQRCTLPRRFNFGNPPTPGTLYNCSEISTCHGDECLKP